MSDGMGYQKLQGTEQRPEVTGWQESRAPTVERAQGTEFQMVEANSRVEVVSVQMKRGTEKVRSPDDDGSREIVVFLMLCSVILVNMTVAELFCEDRFGGAAVGDGFECGLGEHATGWDIEDKKMWITVLEMKHQCRQFVLQCAVPSAS